MKHSEDHFKLLRKLDKNQNFSQRELADDLGFSLGKLNYCLNELKKKGFIKFKNFKENKKKISYLYVLTPSGMEMKKNLLVSFMKKKMNEYDELKNEMKDLK